ncbi:MAG TPA: hypothetical protein VFK32_09785 [Tepidiformaceae bacterium]|nr:hypothetical protein [Tepidiformaceae bacterium]
MTRLAAALLALCLLALPLSTSAQQPGDSATIALDFALVGEQTLLTLDVLTPATATVEPDPANASWNGVEIIRVQSLNTAVAGETATHRLELVVAGFVPGQVQFQPAVFVVLGTETSNRLLPALSLNVISSLTPDDPLELSPLPPPAAIDGAESPLLRPAIAAGALLVLVLVGGATWLVVRRVMRRRPAPPTGVLAPAPVDLVGAESLLDRDPVAAYRTLSAAVRDVLGSRYGFPARALTTGEMDHRMQAAGVDRWQARLVTGLLEECDAVVYAGYRPAAERRHADLNMAREIVGEAS